MFDRVILACAEAKCRFSSKNDPKIAHPSPQIVKTGPDFFKPPPPVWTRSCMDGFASFSLRGFYGPAGPVARRASLSAPAVFPAGYLPIYQSIHQQKTAASTCPTGVARAENQPRDLGAIQWAVTHDTPIVPGSTIPNKRS